MSKSFLGVALTSLLVLSGTAFADDFFHFEDAGGVIWWNSAMNVYVNPYTAKDTTTSQTLSVYCDDWNSDFSGNPSWYATVTPLTGLNFSTLSTTSLKYKAANPVFDLDSTGYTTTSDPSQDQLAQRYLEAAWLDNKWRTGTPGFDQRILAAAVWTLFVNKDHVGGLVGAIKASGYTAEVISYLDAAEAGIVNWDAAGWYVITPDTDHHVGDLGPGDLHQDINGADMQEFMYYSSPEPGAVILLGTVLGILGLTKFHRKVRA